MQTISVPVFRRFVLVLLLFVALATSCTQTARPSPSASGAAESEKPSLPAASVPAFLAADSLPPPGAAEEFSTDFTRHTVPYSEILSGGPPKDGIPAIDDPQYESVHDAGFWLSDQEPVILVRAGPEARAYPVRILVWHEIVNDEPDGIPLVVTYCPLCNTAVAFRRTHDGRVLDFGTTGRLRFSNLLMYDRQTETWWQQADGRGIAGRYAGDRLAFHPAPLISWAEFKAAYPAGSVLSRNTGHSRDYGRNPYAGYDAAGGSPFLYRGPAIPGALPPMTRVLTLELDGETVAYPYGVLEERRAVNDRLSGRAVAVLWIPGTASPLDSERIDQGRDVGSARAFGAASDGRGATLEWSDGAFRDRETGSEWDALGRAVSGPRTGARLDPLTAVDHFWFSWAAFQPGTRIYGE